MSTRLPPYLEEIARKYPQSPLFNNKCPACGYHRGSKHHKANAYRCGLITKFKGYQT